MIEKKVLFRYCLGLSFIAALVFFFLDLIMRSVSLIQYFSPFLFVVNASYVILFLSVFVFLLAFIMYGLEILWGKMHPTKGAVVSSYIFFFVVVYINLMHLKFRIASSNPVEKGVLAAEILFVLSFVVAWFLRKKLNFNNLKDMSFFFCDVFKYVFFLSLFVASVSYVLALVPKKKEEGKPLHPSVVFVTFDSLTAEHMSLYGYPVPTTPNLEKLAKNSYVVSYMVTNCNNTDYALHSILGRYPRRDIPSNPPAFTHVLLKNGYKTTLFLSFFHMPSSFRRAFSEYVILYNYEDNFILNFLKKGRNRKNVQWLLEIADERKAYYDIFDPRDPRSVFRIKPNIMPMGFKYIVRKLKESSQPIFVWYHVFEPHLPYTVPNNFEPKFGKTLSQQYDTAIRYADSQLGKFIEELKREGLFDSVILVISADHGESMGFTEGGVWGLIHGGNWINRFTVHIPLIVRIPHQKEGRWAETFAESVDVAPTILNLLDISIPSWMEGESLVPYLKGEKRLSKKMKISIPVSHFLRYKEDIRPKLRDVVWTDAYTDMFNVYWYKYKVGYVQVYKENPNNPRLINRLVKFAFYCVYDLAEDPQQRNNLLKDSAFDYILKKVYESPLVKEYQYK